MKNDNTHNYLYGHATLFNEPCIAIQKSHNYLEKRF